jgi:hypothetical protein
MERLTKTPGWEAIARGGSPQQLYSFGASFSVGYFIERDINQIKIQHNIYKE